MPESLLDTNAWTAILLGGEPSQQVLEAVGTDLVLVSTIALAELSSLEQRFLAPKGGVQQVQARARVLPLSPEAAIEAGRLHGKLRRAGNTKVSLADVLMYVSAQHAKATFITFDPDLKGRPGVRCVQG